MERNRGRFRPIGGEALGPRGECECIECGYTEPHKVGRPCLLLTCPKCGGKMRRKVK